MTIKTDEFVDSCIRNNFDATEIGKDLRQSNPGYTMRKSQIENRIANLRRKGDLPLDSGNAVSAGELLKGTSTLYDAAGNVKQQWVKSDVAATNTVEAVQKAIDDIIDNANFAKTTIKPPKKVNSDLMTIYPIGDAHVGMLAHAAEVGQDHDLAISRERHLAAIKMAVENSPDSEEAFIIDTGDWFHADDSNNRTPRGNNPLDVDGRFHKVIDVGFEIAVGMIETALAKHKIVHWHSAEGNHNQHLAYVMSKFLKGYFRDLEAKGRVVIHCSPKPFYYYKFGKNLIGITHGHTTKVTNLPGIMATDEPKQWGDTVNRYWYCGHIHHDVIKELPGCKVESFRTLAGKDAWHNASGYRSGQDLKAITLHKKHGEISRNTFNLSLIEQ